MKPKLPDTRTSPLRRSLEARRDSSFEMRRGSISRRFPRTEIVRDQNNNVFLNSSDFPRLFKHLSATGNAVKVTDRDIQRKLPYISGERSLITPRTDRRISTQGSYRDTQSRAPPEQGLTLTVRSKGELSIQEMEEMLNKQKDYQDKVKVSMRDIFERFFMDDTSERGDVVSLKKVAKLLEELGITKVDPADYQILQEVLDKDKDGVVSFRDLLNLIPQARISMAVPAGSSGSTVYNPSQKQTSQTFATAVKSPTPPKKPNDVFLLDEGKFNKLKDTVLK